MIPYSIYFKLGLVLVLVIIVSFFYIDYVRLQNKAIDLSKQIENFESQISIQEQHIQNLEYNFKKQDEIKKELDKEIKIIVKEVGTLQEKVWEHDLARLANKKTNLVQKAINNGTSEMIRCIELATGSEAKINEKNKTCPSLISTN